MNAFQLNYFVSESLSMLKILTGKIDDYVDDLSKLNSREIDPDLDDRFKKFSA